MLSKLWALVKNRTVGDVPDEMSACLDCNEIQCRDDQYETCPNRLRMAAALHAIRQPDGTDKECKI